MREVVYDVQSADRSGLGEWSKMIGDVIQSRELIWRLWTRDLSVRFRQSVLGYAWIFLPAIASVVLFTYLRSANIFNIRDTRIPYPAYVLYGLLVWQFFSSGLSATTGSLAANEGLLSKINIPREVLVIASLGNVLFDFVVRSLLVGGVFAWFGVVPAWTVVLLPLILFPLGLLVLGIGFILALVNAIVRDMGQALSMALGLLFFSVPVLYPPSEKWPHVLLNDLNPVSAYVIAAYDVAIVGHLSRPVGYMTAALFSFLIFGIGWRIFRKAQPLLAERI